MFSPADFFVSGVPASLAGNDFRFGLGARGSLAEGAFSGGGVVVPESGLGQVDAARLRTDLTEGALW